MASQTRQNQEACRLQRLTVARSQATIDSFPRALSLIENSYSKFVSAIGCFIGRLYLVSQSQQEFASTVERLKTCCEDLVLSIENAWLRLHIGAQMIKSRLADTRMATQTLISAIGTLTFDDMSNVSKGCRLNLGREWSDLFALALDLFRVANSLVSDARFVSARLSWRQRELKARQVICAGTSGGQVPKNAQTTPQTGTKPKSTFSLFPRCAASLESRPERTASAEPTLTGSTPGLVHSKTSYLHRPLCSRSHKTSRSDPSGMHQFSHGPHYRPVPTSQKNTRDECPKGEPASTLSQVPQKHDDSIDTDHSPSTAQAKSKDSTSSETHPTISGDRRLRKTVPPIKTYKRIFEGQNSLLSPQWQSRRPLSSITEGSEPCRQSWREASLTPCGLRASQQMLTNGGRLSRLVRLHRSLWRKLSSCGNSCRRSVAGVRKSFVGVKRRSGNAMA